ncbi:MAG: NAD-dependent epimerase/dehydratase family protein [Deltaproteobacteria bacterium]|nr:MAG: NAD-dependent epimerase/dehydratase family protein [Deltaproteobacteria bacterium]
MGKDKVVVAGATGFVGEKLLQEQKEDLSWVGLSRRDLTHNSTEQVEWRTCDLFSMLDAEQAVMGAKYGIYLVHSMMPSARLTQGHFMDLDLIAADNFARAAANKGLEQIIYLSGIVPQDCAQDPDKLSPHLRSRLEVEKTLSAYGVPVTTLRAGLILGEGGSSFNILKNLVERLPVMVCPSWTSTESHPIARTDVIKLLMYCLGNPTTFGETYDIGGDEAVSYRDLILRTAKEMGLERRTFGVPFVSPSLSRLWVSLVTGAPKELVKPLVQSLRHDMRVTERRLQEKSGIAMTPLDQALRQSLQKTAPAEAPQPRSQPSGSKRKSCPSEVRSVQRMRLPQGTDALFVAQEYMRWLPKLLPWFLRVDVDSEGVCTFRVRWLPIKLLVLAFSPERSRSDRQLFYIRGGVLAKHARRGRLEFREVLEGRYILAAIHEFQPRLPWYVYRFTQAQIHLWVMHRFDRRLERINKNAYKEPLTT